MPLYFHSHFKMKVWFLKQKTAPLSTPICSRMTTDLIPSCTCSIGHYYLLLWELQSNKCLQKVVCVTPITRNLIINDNTNECKVIGFLYSPSVAPQLILLFDIFLSSFFCLWQLTLSWVVSVVLLQPYPWQFRQNLQVSYLWLTDSRWEHIYGT